MADHGGSNGGGEVVDRSEDRGGPMAVEEVDRMAAEPARVKGAEVTGGGEGIQGREQEGGDQENPRAAEGEPRARVETGVVEPSSDPVDLGMAAEGSPFVGGSSSAISGSGAVGGDTGPSGSSPRDSAKGKGIVVEEKQAKKEQITEAAIVEIREENIAFRLPVTVATSSRHVRISLDDIAEHAPDEIVAKLLEITPSSGSMFLKPRRIGHRPLRPLRPRRGPRGRRRGREPGQGDWRRMERPRREWPRRHRD
ncbi:hypothetical protein RHMOL_Rhmol09G0096400 [Rhododendron molle]|uniref:Uncharacterized protein n=1 Tax=Rhododendron molle TaxID=49168 RepID=A0ACC0MBC5_RHOML|nr:hypothetical protein RHMOL_Rhmol09G0096400 [Rhododendron molle]